MFTNPFASKSLVKSCEQCSKFYSEKNGANCKNASCWVRDRQHEKKRNLELLVFFLLFLLCLVGGIGGYHFAVSNNQKQQLADQKQQIDSLTVSEYKYHRLYDKTVEDAVSIKSDYNCLESKYGELSEKYDSLNSTKPKIVYIRKVNFSLCTMNALRKCGDL